MESLVWISYDLGVIGDYEGIYSWLDSRGAKECGDNLAFLTYCHTGDLIECLRDDISKEVILDKRSRIYAVRMVEGQVKGRFVVGRRKTAPWEGYGDVDDDTEDAA